MGAGVDLTKSWQSYRAAREALNSKLSLENWQIAEKKHLESIEVTTSKID